LIKSIQNGDWVLLDEINLASDAVLNKLATIIEGNHILLNERADIVETKTHPDFRIFMCMNPPYSSAGKKQLPTSLRVKLTELYAAELENETDLWPIVDRNAPSSMFSERQKRLILQFYMNARKEMKSQSLKANIGLRNLSRALKMMRASVQLRYPVIKAIYDSLFTCFASHLDANMQLILHKMIYSLFEITHMPTLEMTGRFSEKKEEYAFVEEFIIRKGGHKPLNFDESDFILTPSFRKLVKRLASIVAVTDYATILEGPTSAGKTSTVQYLANVTENKVIRINNHMHTDI
jgi:midasin